MHQSRFSELIIGRNLKKSQAHPCIFPGYPYGQKAYKLLDLTTKKVFTSQDVQFHEKIFPFQGIQHSSETLLPASTHYISETQFFTPQECPSSSDTSTVITTTLVSSSSDLPNSLSGSPAQRSPSSLGDTAVASQNHVPAAVPQLSVKATQQPHLRRTIKPHHKPKHLQDYFCGVIHSAHLPVEHHALVSALTQYHGPTSYEEASKDLDWVQAMHKEIEALLANNTWELVTLPPGKRAISNKWVYRVKLNSDGTLERLKARLVIGGFT